MIHVAIIHRPFLDAILAGEKTAELRLSTHARAPFGRVAAGERIYLKQASGPFRATAVVDRVESHEALTPHRLRALQKRYAAVVGAGHEDFWRHKRNAKYASVIFLRDVEAVSRGPAIPRSRGLAWYVLPDDADVYPECRVAPSAVTGAGSGPGPEPSRTNGVVRQPISALSASPSARATRRAMPSSPAGRSSGSAVPVATPPDGAGPIALRVTASSLRHRHLAISVDAAARLPDDAFGGNTRMASGRPIRLRFPSGDVVATDIVESRRIFRTRRPWAGFFASEHARPGDVVLLMPRGKRLYDVSLQRCGAAEPCR